MAIGWSEAPGIFAAVSDGAASGAGQYVALLLGLVGVATGGYGIYRTNRVDNKAAKSTDVNDAINLMKESNAMVKDDLKLARNRILEQEEEIARQADEIVRQAQQVITQTQHINAVEAKIAHCEKTCEELLRRVNEMEQRK
ncbi:MAG: hypothetical protein H0V67_02565 [Geodermatophilaceae bacterium]|nr:hypothetical protein [Geodermatophilaceae bacterium]